jgi:hypothetical protein
MAIKKELSKTQWKKQQAVEHNHLRDWRMAIDEHMLRGFEWDRYRKVSTPSVKRIPKSITISSVGEHMIPSWAVTNQGWYL